MPDNREELLLEHLLELEADGYELNADKAVVHGPFHALKAFKTDYDNGAGRCREWEHLWHPGTNVKMGVESAEQCLKLLDALDNLDDVRSISANLEIES